MWLRDDVRCNDLADSLARRGAGINGTPHSSYITTNDCGHQTRVDLFPTDEANLRGFNHGVGGFDHRDQAAAFHHSKCFRHQLPPVPQIVAKPATKRHKKQKTILTPSCHCALVVQFRNEWMGAGILPPRRINAADENRLTAIIGALPNNPPNSTISPTSRPGTGMMRTAVVLLFMVPIAISSAIIAARVSAVVEPGTATI